MNPKLKTYFIANDLKRPNLLGLIYNILFSIRGRPIIFIYYCVHFDNIIIDSNVELGNDCQIDQNVTIGGNMKKSKSINGELRNRPIIGDNVILCAGCLVAGPIVVASNCIVGANATLTFDTESGSIVANVAKVTVKNILVNNGSYQLNNHG